MPLSLWNLLPFPEPVTLRGHAVSVPLWNLWFPMAIRTSCSLYTGMPYFSEVHFMTLCFYERPTLVPVFANWKKFNEDFCFLEKGWKAKIAFSICFAVSHCRDSGCCKQWEWHFQAPSLDTTLGISASSCRSYELCQWTPVLYLNLFCASIGMMCPKVISSLLYAMLAYEHFHRSILLLDGGESESEVAQLCPTLCDPMDYGLPGSSIHGIF